MDKSVPQNPSKTLTPRQAFKTFQHVVATPPRQQPLAAALAGYQFFEPAVLLSCGVSYRRLTVVNDMTMAEAFRKSWTCQPLKQPRVPTVALCHIDGVIRKVYKDLKWIHTVMEAALLNNGEYLARILHGDGDTMEWAFVGNEAPEYHRLIGLDLSNELTRRGMANPVRYVNCHETE